MPMPSLGDDQRAIRWQGDLAILRVRLTPKSSTDSVDGTIEWGDAGHVLQVRVRAKPDKGEANAALIRLLAKYFDVPQSHISLEKGSTSRLKIIAIKTLLP